MQSVVTIHGKLPILAGIYFPACLLVIIISQNKPTSIISVITAIVLNSKGMLKSMGMIVIFQTLYGLSVLTSFGGDLTILYTSLTNLSGLDNVTSFGGDILIGLNDSLKNLTGLGGLTSIEGNINIGYWSYVTMDYWLGNPLLKDLSGLDNLTFIGGDLGIYGNERLKSLTGLENLTSIEGI